MATENEWYFYDPDNNKKDPEIGFFCIRCKRKVKDDLLRVGTFYSVEIHPEHPLCRKAAIGKGAHLIGKDCWDKIVKENNSGYDTTNIN